MSPQMAVENIKRFCGPLIGHTITRLQSAETRSLENEWYADSGLPIRIFTQSGALLAVSWSRFDDLWLNNDESLPCTIEADRVRWVDDGLPGSTSCIGRKLRRVLLGKGQMSVENVELEIWTRLLFDLGERFLEISNALDANDVEVHSAKPDGDFIDCLI